MRLVRLTTCADGMEARIVAARLGAEGIVWSLRGGQDGPFALGAVDLLVAEEDLDVARALLESDADHAGVEHVDRLVIDGEPVRETTMRDVLVAAGVLVLVALFAAARMAVGG